MRPGARAIVHLHSTHSVAVSCLAGIDAADVLPPLTAYYVMRVGRLPLIPYFPPGDERLAAAVRQVAARHAAVLLANHGPVVAADSLDAAVGAVEELEATARLFLLLQGRETRALTTAEVAELERRYPRRVAPARIASNRRKSSRSKADPHLTTTGEGLVRSADERQSNLWITGARRLTAIIASQYCASPFTTVMQSLGGQELLCEPGGGKSWQRGSRSASTSGTTSSCRRWPRSIVCPSPGSYVMRSAISCNATARTSSSCPSSSPAGAASRVSTPSS